MMSLKVSLSMFMTLFGLICIINETNGLDNGLGRTPPMGWNSWNRVIVYCGMNIEIK